MKDIERHNTHDAARCPENRDSSGALLELYKALDENSQGSGEEVEDPEFPPPVDLFELPAAEPEDKHILDDVPEARFRMNEAGGNQPPELREAAAENAVAGGGHELANG